MILGLSDFFGSVIIFVRPIAVVALPPGDQIVPVGLTESIKVLPGCCDRATGVCSNGVANRLTPSVLFCADGAAYVLASDRLSLSLSSRLSLIDDLHAFSFSCDTIRGGRSIMSTAESPSVG